MVLMHLAIPLFARTAPEVDIEHNKDDAEEGRRHKDQTTTKQIIDNASPLYIC